MTRRTITNRNKGITRNPGVYNGYDVLHDVLKQNVNGKTLLPGVYNGITVYVKKSTDPSDKTFYVMAWVQGLDVMEKPIINPNPETLDVTEIMSLNFYEVITDGVVEPTPGQTVRILMTDPANRIGHYLGISPNQIPFTTVVQRENAEGAKNALEQISQQEQKAQQSLIDRPASIEELFTDQEAEQSLNVSSEDYEELEQQFSEINNSRR